MSASIYEFTQSDRDSGRLNRAELARDQETPLG